MDIKLSGYIDDSIVDGPGIRFTVFTQGCPHRCADCHNPQTHDFEGGQWQSTEFLAACMEKNPLLSGLTLSGGEPLLQPESCAALARAAKDAGLNVWLYSGYTFEAILDARRGDWMALLETCDVLVDGPFIAGQRTLSRKFAGSKNQRVLDIPSSLAACRAVCLPGYEP